MSTTYHCFKRKLNTQVKSNKTFTRSDKWLKQKITPPPNAGKDAKKKNPKKLDHSYTADGKVTWYSHSINWFGRFF